MSTGTPLTRESIQELLRTNDRALCRAIVAIYLRQMDDEKHARATLHDNGIGFSGADAPAMSTLARHILEYGPNMIGCQRMADARERMPKYWKQLIDIAVARQFDL